MKWNVTSSRAIRASFLVMTTVAISTAIMASPEPVAFGKSLDQPIVSVYVPPTRSGNPVVATEHKVFLFEDEQNAWEPVYQCAPAHSGILAVSGYAKSSKVLYVAHGGGVARTRDMGRTWDEFVPPGFLTGENFVALIVNPADREEAILALSQQAWITKDYGYTWKPFALPSAAEPLTEIAYTGGENPGLVAGTTHAFYHAETVGKSWRGLMRSVQGPLLIATALEEPYAFAYDILPSVHVYDLSASGAYLTRELQIKETAQELATDFSGRGAVWLGVGDKILFINAQSESDEPELIREGIAPIRNLMAHPRLPNGIIWSEGANLYKLENAIGESARELTGAIPKDAFIKSGLPAQSEVASGSGVDEGQSRGAQDAQKILSEIAAQQPPVEEVVSAALDYANYRPGETERWKANVRRRNLLPTLKVMAGQSQIGVDQNKTVTQVDRYGTSSYDDIRGSDAIKDVDSFRVELGWNLGNLLFDREETDISEETRRRAEYRNQLITDVTQLYYNRMELMIEQRMKQDMASVDETIRLSLRISELSALLNQICGKPLFK